MSKIFTQPDHHHLIRVQGFLEAAQSNGAEQ
jgi:hypothetical protein